jgi:transcriptional antiterminator RfaH
MRASSGRKSELEPQWYLIRTKQHKERLVQHQLAEFVPNTFLPLLRANQLQWGRIAQTIVPLFPCYIFSLFDLQSEYHRIMRTAGVVGLVCAGEEPSALDSSIVEEIRRRGKNGIVELPEEAFHAGQAVQVKNGPLRGLNAVFERYLSGTDRVALLLNEIHGANVRVILPSCRIAPCG